MGRRAVCVGYSVVLIIAMLGLVACGQRESASPKATVLNGTPAISEALRGPGTPLGDGFEVPDGASLVGAALPNHRELIVAVDGQPGINYRRTWTALLIVDGPVDAVYRELVQQAGRLGLRSRSVLGSRCQAPSPPIYPVPAEPGTGGHETGSERGTPAPTRSTPNTTPPGPAAGMECSGGADSSDGALVTPATGFAWPMRSLQVEARQGNCEGCPGGVWPSLAVVTYSEIDDAATPSPTTAPPNDDALPSAPSVKPAQPPVPLPGPGDPILVDFGNARVPVVEGSQPLAPPVCNGCPGSDLWLMHVDDGERVFANYVDAFEHLNRWEDGTSNRRVVRDGWNVHVFGASNADTSVELELFQRAGEPAYLRLQLANGA